MYGNAFDGIGYLLIVGLVAMSILVCAGIYACVDYFFIDEVYKTEKLITPEVHLTITDNKVDTVYVYRFK